MKHQKTISILTSIALTFMFTFNFTNLNTVRPLIENNKFYENFSFLTIELLNNLFLVNLFFSLLGCLLAQIFKFRIKIQLIIINSLFLLGGLLQSLFLNYLILCFSRAFIGIATGLCCSIVPSYLSLISNDNNRGLVGSFNQIALVSGFLVSTICRYSFCNENWRITFYISFLIPLFLFAFLPFLEEANLGLNPSKNLLQLFKIKEARFSLITGLLLHSSQHFASINPMIIFTEEIFKNKMMHHIAFNLIQVGATAINSFFIEKLGRKKLLLIGTILVLFSLFSISFNFYIEYAACFFIAGFCLGLGPVVWYLSAEIFPKEYLVVGVSLLSFFNWFIGFIQHLIFSQLYVKYMLKAYLPFSILLSCAFVYFLVFLKETKGKPADFQ